MVSLEVAVAACLIVFAVAFTIGGVLVDRRRYLQGFSDGKLLGRIAQNRRTKG